jgi:hypothetical protein
MLAKLSILFFSLTAFADNREPFVPVTPHPVLQKVQLTYVYAPVGFDNNDRTQIVVQGTFPNSCYRIGPYKLAVDDSKKTVTVTQQAYYYGQGICIQMPVPFSQTIQVGILREGAFSVADGTSGTVLGKVVVTRATNPGPDDYLYAPIGDAYVSQLENGQNNLILSGNFSDRCSSFEDVKVAVNDRVIVVQPIIKRDSALSCPAEKNRFQKVIPLSPTIKGLYLLHVRSLDGQAINKMVDID